ncbi:hypothetical protein NDU88_002490 [Pleurodeles waltl]|uniref:Uncharacterized protein n=1 Tax=Pleurodeles waltl TaxID=8319 RepID=A0AAV7KVU5_PLEWA|nr:hypothetical protein NDU88_002490 [Pleurodeles waltl]
MAHFNAPAPTKAFRPAGEPHALHVSPSSLRVLVPYPPYPGGFPPTDDGGPRDLPGWAPYGLIYLRYTPELLVGPHPEGPEPLRRVFGGFATLVTAGYPQRAAPIRQPILPFTGVPCFGSLHIVLTAHVPQIPGGIFIYVCTRRGDGLLRKGERYCWKRPDAGDY